MVGPGRHLGSLSHWWHHGMLSSWETKQRHASVVGPFTPVSLFVYGDDEFANISAPFQNAMPLDTQPPSVLSSPNSLSNFSQFSFKLEFSSGIRELIDAHRDRFRERGALSHISFWGPMLVWPIWPLVLKTWKYAPLPCITPSKFYLLWWRLWFYDCIKSSTEIRAFAAFLSTANVNALFSWKL